MSSKGILCAGFRMGRIFAFFLAAGTLRAQQDRATWHVLIEPSFMHPPVSFPIPGAERTVLVPAYLPPDGDPVYLSKKDWDAAAVNWDDFRARASQNATDKKVGGRLIRNSKQVVEYAVVASQNPLTETMVLAPDFLKKFRDIFGDKVLVALPNRFTVYIFPGQASDYRDYSSMILAAYHDSPYPVSLEVFEISAQGMRAIGAFEE